MAWLCTDQSLSFICANRTWTWEDPNCKTTPHVQNNTYLYTTPDILPDHLCSYDWYLSRNYAYMHMQVYVYTTTTMSSRALESTTSHARVHAATFVHFIIMWLHAAIWIMATSFMIFWSDDPIPVALWSPLVALMVKGLSDITKHFEERRVMHFWISQSGDFHANNNKNDRQNQLLYPLCMRTWQNYTSYTNM